MTAGLVVVAAAAFAGWAGAWTLPRFEFGQTGAWKPRNDVSSLEHTADGMIISISGPDPFITGPAQDFPSQLRLWLVLRLKSDEGGSGQFFWYRGEASEQNSIRFPVRKGEWEDVRVPLPPLGAGYQLRFDPPGTSGKCVLASLSFEPRLPEPPPAAPAPPARQ